VAKALVEPAAEGQDAGAARPACKEEIVVLRHVQAGRLFVHERKLWFV
jgi:hypothetical protein